MRMSIRISHFALIASVCFDKFADFTHTEHYTEKNYTENKSNDGKSAPITLIFSECLGHTCTERQVKDLFQFF